MPDADVTICIPTWQAASFIARTLAHATNQTHQQIRIMVAVDQCEDDTAAICKEAASTDPRIEVFIHTSRLGWSENANFLLSKVDTPYFFFYFHDDIIAPEYTTSLRALLVADPTAMSAHCDLEKFGAQELVERGNPYLGPTATRLLTYLSEEVKGPLLRGMIRSEVLASGLSFPSIAGNGNWRVPPFAMRLLAAGPALHLPGVLYRRWMGEGTMTTTWHPRSAAELVAGQAECTRLCLEIIEGIDASPDELSLVLYALYLHMMLRTRRAEKGLKEDAPIDPSQIAPSFASMSLPANLQSLPPDLLDATLRSLAELWRHEGRRALGQGDIAAAWPLLSTAAALDPLRPTNPLELARLLYQLGHRDATAAIAVLQHSLHPDLETPAKMIARHARRGKTTR
jgi:hypothetical protein